MPRLTRPAFRAFLASKKPTYRFVDKTGAGWYLHCPLASFLDVDVRTTSYDGDTKELPVWAQKFITAVDALNGDKLTSSVSAKRALAILDSLK